MTTAQIIEAAQDLLPYTSEFEHEVIRIPVKNKNLTDAQAMLQANEATASIKTFYEVEFRKLYIKNIVVGWEFVKLY